MKLSLHSACLGDAPLRKKIVKEVVIDRDTWVQVSTTNKLYNVYVNILLITTRTRFLTETEVSDSGQFLNLLETTFI